MDKKDQKQSREKEFLEKEFLTSRHNDPVLDKAKDYGGIDILESDSVHEKDIVTQVQLNVNLEAGRPHILTREELFVTQPDLDTEIYSIAQIDVPAEYGSLVENNDGTFTFTPGEKIIPSEFPISVRFTPRFPEMREPTADPDIDNASAGTNAMDSVPSPSVSASEQSATKRARETETSETSGAGKGEVVTPEITEPEPAETSPEVAEVDQENTGKEPEADEITGSEEEPGRSRSEFDKKGDDEGSGQEPQMPTITESEEKNETDTVSPGEEVATEVQATTDESEKTEQDGKPNKEDVDEKTETEGEGLGQENLIPPITEPEEKNETDTSAPGEEVTTEEPATPDESEKTEQDDKPDKENVDHGHGNDEDGVDQSNPATLNMAGKDLEDEETATEEEELGQETLIPPITEPEEKNETDTSAPGKEVATEEPATPDESKKTEQARKPDKEDVDHGHGNDEDGVDESNPATLNMAGKDVKDEETATEEEELGQENLIPPITEPEEKNETDTSAPGKEVATEEPATPDESEKTEQAGQSDKEKVDHGHGNDEDGVDESNPATLNMAGKDVKDEETATEEEELGQENLIPPITEPEEKNETDTSAPGKEVATEEPATPDESKKTEQDDKPDKENVDHGHGNDEDGVDESNPAFQKKAASNEDNQALETTGDIDNTIPEEQSPKVRLDDPPQYGTVEVQLNGEWEIMELGREYDADSQVRFMPDKDTISALTRDIRVEPYDGSADAPAPEESVPPKTVEYTQDELTVTVTSADDNRKAYSKQGAEDTGIEDHDAGDLSKGKSLIVSVDGEDINQASFDLNGIEPWLKESAPGADDAWTKVHIKAFDSEGNLIEEQFSSGAHDAGNQATYTLVTNTPVDHFELTTSGGMANYDVRGMTLSKSIATDFKLTTISGDGTEDPASIHLNLQNSMTDESVEIVEHLGAAEGELNGESSVRNTLNINSEDPSNAPSDTNELDALNVRTGGKKNDHEDHGHGNDEDGVDESNPAFLKKLDEDTEATEDQAIVDTEATLKKISGQGAEKAQIKDQSAVQDDGKDDHGHGNDEDGVDESNPAFQKKGDQVSEESQEISDTEVLNFHETSSGNATPNWVGGIENDDSALPNSIDNDNWVQATEESFQDFENDANTEDIDMESAEVEPPTEIDISDEDHTLGPS